MPRAIFKYQIQVGEESSHWMPSGARLLFVDNQKNVLTLWAEVNPGNEPKVRYFVVHGTGHPIPDDGRAYVGSCQMGEFVWHVYERFYRPRNDDSLLQR